MHRASLIFAAFAAFALWFFWALVPVILSLTGQDWNAESLGQWGDSFGALNAFLSSCAFVAILVTLRMQTKEIAGQQAEIGDQRKRLERSERNADLQQFEATFFQLFELSRELRDRVSFVINREDPVKGYAAFEKGFLLLDQNLQPTRMFPGMKAELEPLVCEYYSKEVHSRAEGTLGPYFRVLYTILRRISEKTDLSETEKARYGNLVRSQLSSAEVGLIAANALTTASNDFKRFVIEFRLLKYLPQEGYRSMLEKIYPAEAFAPRD